MNPEKEVVMYAFPAPTRRAFVFTAILAPALAVSASLFAADICAERTDLVADTPAAGAAHTDANLVNPWGIAFNPGGIAWVANNHTGTATAYDSNGVAAPLVVSIPGPAAGPAQGAPTGIVFNATPDFVESGGAPAPATYIFAGEDGVISAWNPALDATSARRVVDDSASGAIYKGLAIANNGTANRLYAADFHNGRIAVFDANFAPVTVPGGFADRSIPRGFAPWNVQNVGGVLYVMYAMQDAAKEDEVAGRGRGIVDAFDANGYRLSRVAQRGHLNAPWGIAQIPGGASGAGDLLIGNFGDGTIGAYEVGSGRYLGQVRDANGRTLSIDGLWGLAYSGTTAASPLFFAAGTGDEEHGLFGKLTGITCPAHKGHGHH
jgi:uncharacterized protein (TIGR03118 family)